VFLWRFANNSYAAVQTGAKLLISTSASIVKFLLLRTNYLVLYYLHPKLCVPVLSRYINGSIHILVADTSIFKKIETLILGWRKYLGTKKVFDNRKK
jgi:hypothetical protein